MLGPAEWSNRRVAIKQYATTDTLSIKKRETLRQLKEMKDLQHDNLAAFYGICLDHKDRILVAWELCHKGSLSSVLFGDNSFELDATFRGCIIRDLASGLDFLHRSPLAL